VPGKERDCFPGDLGEGDPVGRRAVGRLDLDLAHVREEIIKTEPPNTPTRAEGMSAAMPIRFDGGSGQPCGKKPEPKLLRPSTNARNNDDHRR
jgi:hypothetical protein